MIRRLLSLGWILALPVLWLYSLWMSARTQTSRDENRFAERLGRHKIALENRNGILIHAASVGEIVAATPLVRQLQKDVPDLPLTLTCTSLTGAKRLRAEFDTLVTTGFLPLDSDLFVRRFLDALHPRLIVLMETELWPNLLTQARQRCIPVVVANARLSARSCRSYLRFPGLTFDIVSSLTMVLAQDRASARRFRFLGLSERQLVVTGNLKFDVQPDSTQIAASALMRARIGPRQVLVAVSTHDGEEELLLQAWSQLTGVTSDWLMVLVPRHPQRFDAVARLIENSGYPCIRRSRGQFPSSSQGIWLGDTMGEIQAWCALADLAFIGGSLVPHGGHNTIEALMHQCPVISGRHVHNFSELFRKLDRHSGVFWIEQSNASLLGHGLSSLMHDSGLRSRMAMAGEEVYREGAGAAERTVGFLKHVLSSRAGASSHHTAPSIKIHRDRTA